MARNGGQNITIIKGFIKIIRNLAMVNYKKAPNSMKDSLKMEIDMELSRQDQSIVVMNKIK